MSVVTFTIQPLYPRTKFPCIRCIGVGVPMCFARNLATSVRGIPDPRNPVVFASVLFSVTVRHINLYPTAFPYGNGMVLHFYQQQESSTTKTVHKVINKGFKTYV